MSIHIFVTIIAIFVIIQEIFIYNLLKRVNNLENKLSVHTTRLNNQTDCILILTSILEKVEKDFYNEENK